MAVFPGDAVFCNTGLSRCKTTTALYRDNSLLRRWADSKIGRRQRHWAMAHDRRTAQFKPRPRPP